MPTESPELVKGQGCAARHSVEREEGWAHFIAFPILVYPRQDSPVPCLAFPCAPFPPSRCLRNLSGSPAWLHSLRGALASAPPPGYDDARSAGTRSPDQSRRLFLARRPIAKRRTAQCRLPRHRFRPAPLPWERGRPGRARPAGSDPTAPPGPRARAMKTQVA